MNKYYTYKGLNGNFGRYAAARSTLTGRHLSLSFLYILANYVSLQINSKNIV